jgi:hypothetical protein
LKRLNVSVSFAQPQPKSLPGGQNHHLASWRIKVSLQAGGVP